MGCSEQCRSVHSCVPYLALAFPNQVAGLLLVEPSTSLTDVAALHYPFLPVITLLRERYDSQQALSSYWGGGRVSVGWTL